MINTINTIIYKIKKRPYQFFIIKLIFFFVLVFLIDFIIGSQLNQYYFRLKRGANYRTTYSIDSTKADILIFGSSRANHHYRPDIIENRMNMTCYNVGRGATSILYHYAILKGILKRYSPKIIILEFAILNKDQFSYDKMSFLLPYYGNHPEIRPFIILKSPFEKYKLVSKIYPFNSTIFTTIAGNIINKERDDINGYVPLLKKWDEPVRIDSINKKYELDKNKIDCFENFIKDCNNMGIQLFVCISPFFTKTTYSEYSTIIGQKIAETHNVKFYDFSNDTIFTSNNSLFADDIHLNDSGARVFTNIVINRILNDK